MPVRPLLDEPARRGAYQRGPGRYATMGESNPNYRAADLLMTDVVSFDVRVLVGGDNDFHDLFDPQVQQYSGGNSRVHPPPTAPRVFDTWSNQTDPLIGTNYTTWMTPGAATSIPLYMTPAPNARRSASGDPDHAAGLGFQDEKDPSGDDRAADVSARKTLPLSPARLRE